MNVLLVSISIVALSATSALACGMNKTAGHYDMMTTASIDPPMSNADTADIEPATEASEDVAPAENDG